VLAWVLVGALAIRLLLLVGTVAMRMSYSEASVENR
jgi:hypothetical protein